MFSKSADPISEPNASRGKSARSFIGADLVITGEITSNGTIELAGKIEGNVKAATLSLADTGSITGEIKAQSLDITGVVTGKIDSDGVTLRAGGQAKADIAYKTLVIESGALVEGAFSRKAD